MQQTPIHPLIPQYYPVLYPIPGCTVPHLISLLSLTLSY